MAGIERLSEPYRRPLASVWCTWLALATGALAALVVGSTLLSCYSAPADAAIPFNIAVMTIAVAFALASFAALLSAVSVALDEQVRLRRVTVEIAAGKVARVGPEARPL